MVGVFFGRMVTSRKKEPSDPETSGRQHLSVSVFFCSIGCTWPIYLDPSFDVDPGRWSFAVSPSQSVDASAGKGCSEWAEE